MMAKNIMFKIEDEKHAELLSGAFETFAEAVAQLKIISKISWGKEPNKCPCTNWKDCERNYQIVQYDNSKTPWIELRRSDILTISSKALVWLNQYI